MAVPNFSFQSVTIAGSDVTGVDFIGAPDIAPPPKTPTAYTGPGIGRRRGPNAGKTEKPVQSGAAVSGMTGAGSGQPAALNCETDSPDVNKPSGDPGGPNARGGGGDVYYGQQEAGMVQSDAPVKQAAPAPAPGVTAQFYHWDHVGTVRLITDNAGHVVSRHDYTPYGVEVLPTVSVSGNTHQFTGQERDPMTGSDYMHFRYYGSNIGRFYRPDNGSDQHPDIPESWNLYTYVQGNPLVYNDPSGKLHFYSAEGAEAFSEAASYLEKCKEGRKVMAALRALHGKKDVGIVLTNKGSDEYVPGHKPDGNIIYWNPNGGLDVSGQGGSPDSKGGEIQSPALQLLHEAQHALDYANDPKAEVDRARTGDPQYGDKEERKVITDAETKAAEELDEPTRRKHAGKFVETTGPTSKHLAEPNQKIKETQHPSSAGT